jgi:hypothetical protein
MNYSPVVQQAVHRIPEGTVIRDGKLAGTASQLLAENRRFAIVIDLEGTRRLGQTSDAQLELRHSDLKICSLLGCLIFEYPKDGDRPLGRSAMIPWWGAWEPVILTGIGIAGALLLLLTWAALAAVYMWPVKFIAYYADREVSWGGAWRMSGAAVLPGALVMIGGIFLYGWQWIDLIRLGFIVALHLVVGWTYIAAAPLQAPRIAVAAKGQNPFAPAVAAAGEDSGGEPSGDKNPFA